jgi:hypothetical protein
MLALPVEHYKVEVSLPARKIGRPPNGLRNIFAMQRGVHCAAGTTVKWRCPNAIA